MTAEQAIITGRIEPNTREEKDVLIKHLRGKVNHLEKMLRRLGEVVAFCNKCGCTEENACPDSKFKTLGCHWVEYGLCSECG